MGDPVQIADSKNILIGCQSWGYEDWVTPVGGETIFYPAGTRKADMLPAYSRVFRTIEVDATVYGVPAATTVEKWFNETPDDFVFSLKMPREITHERSLDATTRPIVEEFVERASLLGDKLGVMLVQLPASFEAVRENAQNLRKFAEALPAGFRYAFEFRHAGWFNDWTYDEIAESGHALALVEGKWVPRELMFASLVKVQQDFAYLRFMGERDLEKFDRVYRERDETLEHWSKVIARLEAKDIYIYADNYFEGHAPATANKLNALLGLKEAEPALLEDQPSLF